MSDYQRHDGYRVLEIKQDGVTIAEVERLTVEEVTTFKSLSQSDIKRYLQKLEKKAGG